MPKSRRTFPSRDPKFSPKRFIYISADWFNSSKRIDYIDCTWYSASQTVIPRPAVPVLKYLCWRDLQILNKSIEQTSNQSVASGLLESSTVLRIRNMPKARIFLTFLIIIYFCLSLDVSPFGRNGSTLQKMKNNGNGKVSALKLVFRSLRAFHRFHLRFNFA